MEKLACGVDNNATEIKQGKVLALLWGITLVLVSAGMYFSTWVFPEVDSLAVLRVVAMRFAPLLLFNMLLVTTIVLWDFVTPGDSLACMNSDPKSAAIFYSTFVASLAYMVVWIA
jgi:hypothetical protein